MMLSKILSIIMKQPDWEKYQLTKYEREYSQKKGSIIISKTDLERKIENFSKDEDGLLLISNSERKKLIEEEVITNIKKLKEE